MGAPGASDPYAALLAQAELELELVGRGELDAAAALAPRWRALEAALPSTATPAGAQTLARATLIEERSHVELLRSRDAVLRELADVRRARNAARGYGRTGRPARGVERSA